MAKIKDQYLNTFSSTCGTCHHVHAVTAFVNFFLNIPILSPTVITTWAGTLHRYLRSTNTISHNVRVSLLSAPCLCYFEHPFIHPNHFFYISHKDSCQMQIWQFIPLLKAFHDSPLLFGKTQPSAGLQGFLLLLLATLLFSSMSW